MRVIEIGQNGRWSLIMAGRNNKENQLGDKQLDEQPIGEEQEVLAMSSVLIMPESNSKLSKRSRTDKVDEDMPLVVYID